MGGGKIAGSTGNLDLEFCASEIEWHRAALLRGSRDRIGLRGRSGLALIACRCWCGTLGMIRLLDDPIGEFDGEVAGSGRNAHLLAQVRTDRISELVGTVGHFQNPLDSLTVYRETMLTHRGRRPERTSNDGQAGKMVKA
ncbi:MAG: hypothetical protein ACNA8P_01490 [Phycisphaerales bacterium]